MISPVWKSLRRTRTKRKKSLLSVETNKVSNLFPRSMNIEKAVFAGYVSRDP